MKKYFPKSIMKICVSFEDEKYSALTWMLPQILELGIAAGLISNMLIAIWNSQHPLVFG